MIEALSSPRDGVLGFRLSGRLHDEDYQHFIPAVEAAIQKHGKVRLLAHFEDFHGWDLPALWDDITFATRHYADVERVALVGEKTWEKWMAQVCKPFTKAELRYFDHAELAAAWEWVAAQA